MRYPHPDERSYLSRRVFLTHALGVVFTLGVEPHLTRVLSRADEPPPNPYRGGVWLAGDHHIHTKYSSDGKYEIAKQVGEAVQHGLGWCVITDHGAKDHDKILLKKAYPDLLEARRAYPNIFVFQGLEWNVPAAEHGTVIMPMGEDEARRLAEFEARFDPKNTSLGQPPDTEEAALEAVRYLERFVPAALFFANHPARRGLVSPHELRAWSDVGKRVMRGFEGAPGHQMDKMRGAYRQKPSAQSWQKYPPESYLTYDGFDWMTATVGGVWDSLLAEGRPIYITANSDSHVHYKEGGSDFFPGEYSKTITWLPERRPSAVLEALRSGSMFTVHGDLIDRLEFYVRAGDRHARMGGTLLLPPRVRRVQVVIRVRVPSSTNFAGQRPTLHHVDLIEGKITGVSADRDNFTNPTARVAARFLARDWKRDDDGYLRMEHVIEDPSEPFYLRVRGTNTSRREPFPDPPNVAAPWAALWFYSNPIFVRLAG
ncbi:MAG: PHP domain-containing protein [Abditibacteriales bacterium]|nr:PHP domain-containing protein [Abditibacteriales bacterium]MDW8364320.1 PHP domain-containing protein [Abditibacteriales bacterium]